MRGGVSGLFSHHEPQLEGERRARTNPATFQPITCEEKRGSDPPRQRKACCKPYALRMSMQSSHKHTKLYTTLIECDIDAQAGKIIA